jgi:hypothetical protein
VHVDGVGPPSARQPPDQTIYIVTKSQSVITSHCQVSASLATSVFKSLYRYIHGCFLTNPASDWFPLIPLQNETYYRYGLGCGVGRGLGVGWCPGVAVGVAVGVDVAVAVGVTVGVTLGVGVGVAPPGQV